VSKSCAITGIGCAGMVCLVVLPVLVLLNSGNLLAAVLFAAIGAFGLVWARLAARRYEKGGFR